MRHITLDTLPMGYALCVQGIPYTVAGLMEITEGRFSSLEYRLLDASGNEYFLTVEKGRTPIGGMLLSAIPDTFSMQNDADIVYHGMHYARFDAGTAKIVSIAGVVDAAVGERCTYGDYRAKEDGKALLCYEQWNDGKTTWWQGTFVDASAITGDGFVFAMNESDQSFEDWANLPLGTWVSVEGSKYYIEGAVYCVQGLSDWWEYTICNNSTAYLSVELVDGKLSFELSKSISLKQTTINVSKGNAIYQGNMYRQIESGNANVVRYKNGYYDPNEGFRFSVYQHEKTGRFLTHEIWEDEQEVSAGRLVPEKSVMILPDKRELLHISAYVKGSRARNIVPLCILLVVALVLLSVNLTDKYTSTVAYQIKRDKRFVSSTTITLREDGKKRAQVYLLDGDMAKAEGAGTTQQAHIDYTTKRIIDMDPERVTAVYAQPETDVPDTLVLTTREQVLCYAGEDGAVYVQVAKLEKRMSIAPAPYRANRMAYTTGFYRAALFAYLSGSGGEVEFQHPEYEDYAQRANQTLSNDHYYSYTSSARQASINARSSSGGGLFSGK